MSRPGSRRAALGAALVGVLLALVSCVTGALPSAASAPRVAASSSAPTIDAVPAHGGDALLRTSHASLTVATGVDRASGGHGSPLGLVAALLLLASGCAVIAVRRSHGWRTALRAGARGCRAPPALV